MALINCPECGNKVSDKASACPKCGWPLSEMNTSSANNPENIMTTENIDIDSEKQLNGFTDEKTIVSVEKQIKEDVTKEVSDAPKAEVNAHIDVAPPPININNQQTAVNRWPEDTPSENGAEEYVKPKMYCGIWYYLLVFAPVISFGILFCLYLFVFPNQINNESIDKIIIGCLWVIDAVLIILDDRYLKKSHDDVDFKWKVLGIILGSPFYVFPRALSTRKLVSLSIYIIIVFTVVVGYIKITFDEAEERRTNQWDSLQENMQVAQEQNEKLKESIKDLLPLNNDYNQESETDGYVIGFDDPDSTANPIPTATPTPTPVPIQSKSELDILWDDSAMVNADSSGYILFDSDYLFLDETDLYGLSQDGCKKARNEIFARHGRRFASQDLQSYFDSKYWYFGFIDPSDFNESAYLNDAEKANVKLIKDFEDSGNASIYQAYTKQMYTKKVIAFSVMASPYYLDVSLRFHDKENGYIVFNACNDEDIGDYGYSGTTVMVYAFVLNNNLELNIYDNDGNTVNQCRMYRNMDYDGNSYYTFDFGNRRWNNPLDDFTSINDGVLYENSYLTMIDAG